MYEPFDLLKGDHDDDTVEFLSIVQHGFQSFSMHKPGNEKRFYRLIPYILDALFPDMYELGHVLFHRWQLGLQDDFQLGTMVCQFVPGGLKFVPPGIKRPMFIWPRWLYFIITLGQAYLYLHDDAIHHVSFSFTELEKFL